MPEVLITAEQFGRALNRLAALSPEQRKAEARRLNASGARGYYVRSAAGELSLKLVTRAAYEEAGIAWPPGEGPQSAAVYREFEHDFELVHRPQSRAAALSLAELAEEDAREREYVQRLALQRDAKFRRTLLARDPRCALTGCATVSVLEAAHIQPVALEGSDEESNGLLLRADLHRLFDLGLLAINPGSGKVWLHKSCRADYADELDGAALPIAGYRAAKDAFEQRWKVRAGKS